MLHGSTISTTVTTTVVLGGPTYPSPLRVTRTGIISPSGDGDAGVTSATAGARLTNYGTIAGAAGAYPGTPPAGGAGVDLTAAGTVVNGGTIKGGRGGYLTTGPLGPGGDGVDLASGSRLANSGVIMGGYGGYSFNIVTGGAGGAGIAAVDSRLGNSGVVIGGQAGGGAGGTGGVGIVLQGGSLHNAGSVTGGVGGYGGGYSIVYSGGLGGIGLVASAGATIVNASGGTITGGEGGPTRYGENDGNGGVGVDLTGGAILTNFGAIQGGAAAGYTGQNANDGTGGVAVMAGAGTELRNAGTIIGGAAGADTPLGYPGAYLTAPGGTGVDLVGASLRNTGAITGGVGGVVIGADNSGPFGGYGGTGGAGVAVLSGSTAFNAGTITGGAGGGSPDEAPIYGGNGGAGVYLNGGTLINAGTIAGGAAGYGLVTSGTAGLAVQFGTLASTLVLDPGAMFDGQVAANAAVNDVLLLAGKGGALAGLGTQFIDFTTLAERPGADWTISGAATLVAGGEVIVRQVAALTLEGSLTGAAAIRLDAGATLTADAGLSAATIRFADGGRETLVLNSTDPVTGTLSGFRIGDTIDIASTVTTMSAMGGTVVLLDGQSVVETLTLDGNFTSGQFSLTPDDHGGTDVSLIASGTGQSEARGHAFAVLLHDGFVPFALFGVHAHGGF